MDHRLIAIVPCLNEAAALPVLLQRVFDAGWDCLVIDDGSTDGTFEMALHRTSAVRLEVNLGIGGAVQTGIKYAYRSGYDYCVQIDGDGQHPPDQINRLLTAISADPSTNIVVGSRYIDNNSFRSTRLRRAGSRMISRLIRVLYGFKVSDPTSGLRLLDRHAMALFANRYPADFPEPISIAAALNAGLKIAEVAVEMESRKIGLSSIGRMNSAGYMTRVLSYVMLEWIVGFLRRGESK